jgi:hypothetical protein
MYVHPYMHPVCRVTPPLNPNLFILEVQYVRTFTVPYLCKRVLTYLLSKLRPCASCFDYNNVRGGSPKMNATRLLDELRLG